MGFILEKQEWFNISESINVIHPINRTKDKNTRSSHPRQKKHLTKIQHPCLIKTLSKVDVEGTYLDMIRPHTMHP